MRASDGESQGIRTTVAYFEHLLEFGLATSTVAGMEEGIVVQTPAQESYEPEQNVVVTAPPERVYLFDAETWGAPAMTKLFNDPAQFTEDMLVGFLDANARYVAGVPGGVVRAHKTRPGKVAVVIGGGSGHYPAFCGTVGRGFRRRRGRRQHLHLTVGGGSRIGRAGRARRRRRAAHHRELRGRRDELRARRHPAAQRGHRGASTSPSPTTSPAPSAARRAKRRGIAGDFTVFKCASAAAEEGLDLQGVVRVGGGVQRGDAHAGRRIRRLHHARRRPSAVHRARGPHGSGPWHPR